MDAKLRFMPHGLQAQDARRVQASLFAMEPAKPKCEHAATQWQVRLDGKYDRVCVFCCEIVPLTP